jgi:Transposase
VKLESGPKEGPDDEAIEVYGRADHCGATGAGGGAFDRRGLPQARDRHGDVYGWKAKFGGMDVSEAKRLKQLEDENAKLKRLLADAMLDDAALKDLMTKKF